MSKTILISGANGALGAVTVEHFLERGYTVLGIDNSLEKLGGKIAHQNFHFYGADVADEPLMKSLFGEITREHGQIHGALLLVGGFSIGTIAGTNGKDLQDMFRLNFFSAYHLAGLALSHMLEYNYGRIAFMGAKPALQPMQGKNMVAYSLSKSLLFKLAEIINATAGNKDITASVLVPSILDTPRNRREMPNTDPASWVRTTEVAALFEILLSESGSSLRETVLKLYKGA